MNITIQEYLEKRVSLLRRLPKNALFRNGYADEFYPYPVLHSKKEIEKFTHIQQVLIKAIKHIIENCSVDKDIQKRIPLSKTILEQIKRISSIPYEIGGIRPDYIYTKSGVPVICEINARFMYNGFYMSTYMNSVYSRMYPEYSSLTGIANLQKLLKRTRNTSFAVVKGREDGYDIHNMLLDNPEVSLHNMDSIERVCKKYKTLYLELHQDELEKNLEIVCTAMIRGVRVINDPRTIFIVHDKRILSVLSNVSIMKKYMSKAECDILKKHIIPTYIKGVDIDIFVDAKKHKDKFVAKKSISGKSDGLYIGKDKSDREWNSVLNKDDTLLQPYVLQKEFKMFNPFKRSISTYNLAGVLPIWNDTAYGPGLYRVFSIERCRFVHFIQPLQI
jgi:hypothetical protein